METGKKVIIDCNGSLAYGNIGFGDGELNYIVVDKNKHLASRNVWVWNSLTTM